MPASRPSRIIYVLGILLLLLLLAGKHYPPMAYASSCVIPTISTVWSGTAGDRRILGENVDFTAHESVFAQISNAGPGIMEHANEYGAIYDAENTLIITQQLDATWGDRLNFDSSFNTVYDCDPGLDDDGVFEVVSATDEAGTLRSSSNPREYYFSYDGLNDWNEGAVTIEQWVNYLEKIASIHGRIGRLTVFCHGNSNLLWFSDNFVLHYNNPDIALYNPDHDNNIFSDDHTREQLQRLQNILTSDAHILLFSCLIASNEAGKNMVREIARLTGATVHANSDSTGDYSASGNTDWTLDVVMKEAVVPDDQDWIFDNQEVKDYLDTHDTGIQTQYLSTPMIQLMKNNYPGIMADLQFVMLRDLQLEFLENCDPDDPPDYSGAMDIVDELGMPVLVEMATWAGYINPFFAAVYEAVSTFSKVADFAGWLYANQDRIFINKQIQYYMYYKEDCAEPFADYGVVGDGYLYPPSSLNYGGVYEPLHPETYTPEVVREFCEIWYEYKIQRHDDYERQKQEILDAVDDVLQPMIDAHSAYASGRLCKVLVVGETFVVIGNKGNFTMEHVVLVNDRIIGDQYTAPVDVPPGETVNIQTEFSDIDYITFEVFNTPVQLTFDTTRVRLTVK